MQEAVQEEMPPLEQFSGTDSGLNFLTKESEGWPHRTFTIKELSRGLLTGKYKWTYNNANYREGEIITLISNKDIDFKNCWRTVKDIVLKNIRNGLLT